MKYEVYVEATVAEVVKGLVMTKLLESVERLMVVDPRFTTASELLVGDATAMIDEVILEVTTDPAEFVVVTSIVVGTVEVEGVGAGCVVVSVVASEVGVVLAGVEGEGEGAGAEEVVGAVGAATVVSVVGVVGFSVVEGAAGVDSVVESTSVAEVEGVDMVVDWVSLAVVVTPVPTACLLLGTMPPGISSASICANSRRKESMTAAAGATGGVISQSGRA